MGKSALVLVLFFSLALMVCGDSEDDMYKPKRMPKRPDDGTWRTKDVRDYNDGDLEKLYDQWEKDEEEIPVDELPPWEKEPPPIDMRKVDLQDNDSILKHGKKHRTLMMFATLVGNPTEKETEKETSLWESGLFNANIQVKRYVIEPGRILLQMDDGADSVQIRDFLIAQPNCLEVSLDSKTYDGAGKKSMDKMKPLTKEEVKQQAEKEAEKKAELAKRKAERLQREKEKKEKAAAKKAAKKAKKSKNDEL